MKQNKFGELVFSEADICDLLMQGHSVENLLHLVVDQTVDLQKLKQSIENSKSVTTWSLACDESQSISEFHAQNQCRWHMPDQYKKMDIAEHVLSLCDTQEQLQRCGAELLLYQERGLFDLLRYLKYLVDVMKTNQVIWGVGRGSSVSSYVLYKLQVHRIDSMYYNLDIQEFLR